MAIIPRLAWLLPPRGGGFVLCLAGNGIVPGSHVMAEIEVGAETETANGWSYEVNLFDAGKHYRYCVTLSWADYDLWSHGRVAPSKVICKAFEFLLKNEPAEAIMRKFDCAIIRRYFPQVDKQLPKMV
jgi:hypothetical protein